MKITIEATQEEVKELLQAIGSSKEQHKQFENVEVIKKSSLKPSNEKFCGDKITNPY